MSERTETYDVDKVPSIIVNLHSGDVRIKQGSDGRVVLQLDGSSEELANLDVDATSDSVTLRSRAKKRRWSGGSVSTLVTAPVGSSITVRLGAGDVTSSMQVADLEVHVGSGDIRFDYVGGTAEIKVGSGDIRVGSVDGIAKVASAAGDVRIDAAGEITISTAAGDVYLGTIGDAARIKSATGDVRIRRFAGPDLEIKTMSGDVIVGLVSGQIVNAEIKTLSGDLRNRIKPSAGDKVGSMSLTITSFSGDVTLKTAK